MLHKFLLSCLLFIIAQQLFGQNYAQKWLIDERKLLDFTTDPPILREEGSETFGFHNCNCNAFDSLGNLLFYTNNRQIRNRNHEIISGLGGNNMRIGGSANSQGCLIIPNQRDSDLYYLYTTENHHYSDTGYLHNWTIDMKLDGGNGGIIASERKVIVADSVSEKIVGIQHCNKKDTWMCLHGKYNDELQSWLFTENGLAETPVVSKGGRPFSTVFGNKGQMQFSHRGDMLAINMSYDAVFGKDTAYVNLFSFDNSTGKFTFLNEIKFVNDLHPRENEGFSFLGLEFSPNDSLLYISATKQFDYSLGDGRLIDSNAYFVLQYNVAKVLENGGNAEPYVVYNTDTLNKDIGYLKYGSDGVIYLGISGEPHLAAITKPNNEGAACQFELDYLLLDLPSFSRGNRTFPNFIQGSALGESKFLSSSFDSVCVGSPYVPEVLVSTQFVGLEWTVHNSEGMLVQESNMRTPSFRFDTAGVYIATLLIHGKCVTDTLSDTIRVLPLPEPNLGADTLVCPSTAIVLSAGIFKSYRWSDSSTQSNLTIDSFGLYHVAVMDQAGCMGLDTIEIGEQLGDFAKIIGDSAVCRADTVAYSASTTYKNEWYTRLQYLDSSATAIHVMVNKEDSIFLVATDSIGCRSRDTLVLQLYELPLALAGVDDTICSGDSVLLRAEGIGLFHWRPSEGLSNDTIAHPWANPNTTTTYTLQVADTNGCKKQDFVTIVNQPPPQIVARPDTSICLGDTLLLYFNSPCSTGCSYRWLPDSLIQNFSSSRVLSNPISDQNFQVQIRDSFGCKNRDTVRVLVHPNPTIVPIQDTTICFGDQINIAIETDANEIIWRPDSAFINGKGAVVETITRDSTEVYVQVTNKFGCLHHNTFLLNVFNTPEIGIVSTQLEGCSGDTILLVNSVEAQATHEYLWLPDTLYSDTLLGILTAPQSTMYLQIRDSAYLSCAVIDSFTIDVFESPTVQILASDSVICLGDSIHLRGVSNHTLFQINWLPDSVFSVTDTLVSTIVPSNDFELVLNGRDSNNCLGSDSLNIVVHPLPLIEPLFSDTTICLGDTLELMASSNTPVVWQPNSYLTSSVGSNVVSKPQAETIYTAITSSQQGCRDSVQVGVFFSNTSLPVVSITDTILCPSDKITVLANGAESYDWYADEDLVCSNCDEYQASPGEELRIAATRIGCQPFSLQAIIKGYPILQWTVIIDSLQAEQERTEVTVIPDGAATIEWMAHEAIECIDCLSTSIDNQSDGVFYYFLSDEYGCVYLDSIHIKSERCPLFLPNAFTPNGDGLNDVLQSLGTDADKIKESDIRIINRWGKTVFESAKLPFSWDGRYQGVDQPAGVYQIYVAGSCSGNLIERKQSVVLIR